MPSGYAYKETINQSQLSAVIDLALVRSRYKSFQHFERALRWLASDNIPDIYPLVVSTSPYLAKTLTQSPTPTIARRLDIKEAFFRRTDHRFLAARPMPGCPSATLSPPRASRKRAITSGAASSAVWTFRRQAAQGPRSRERQVEEAPGRGHVSRGDPRGAAEKVVTALRREVVGP